MEAKDGELEGDAMPPASPLDAAGAIDASGSVDAVGETDAAEPSGDEVPDTPHCAPVAQWPVERANSELALFEAIEALRGAPEFSCEGTVFRDLPPLRLTPELRCSARLHSLDMVDRGFFQQTNPDGLGPEDRMAAAGLAPRRWAEWIGWGWDDPSGLLRHLLENDRWGCESLTLDVFTAIGIGYYGGYWTVDIAEPRATDR